MFFLSPAATFASIAIDVEGIEGLTLEVRGNDYLVSVTDTFHLHGMKVNPSGLTLQYTAADTSFHIYGAAEFILGTDTLSISLGASANPGIIIDDGKLVLVEVSITGDFRLRKLHIIPVDLSFDWIAGSHAYSMYGDITVMIETDSLFATLGDAAHPGIVITDGVIDTIDVSISGKFSLKSLAIKPDSLTFVYDRAASQYKIFGSVEVDIEKDTIDAMLGTAKDPGITITNGALDHIFILVSSKFELKKLTIKTDSLGIAWQKGLAGNVFHLFGKVKIEIESDTIAFDFGTPVKPGLVYKDGKIDSLKISTTDDLHFAGFKAGTKNLTLEYSDSVYHIWGQLFLKKFWSALIDLGTGPGSGVTIDASQKPAKITINHAKFDLADIDLGPITLKDIDLVLDKNRVQSASISLELPPGWEIDAGVAFKLVNNALEVDSIGITWETDKISEAIEIPGTGAFIVRLDGGVSGLENPHDFKLNGGIDIVFGGPFTIKGVGEVSLLYLNAGVIISRSEFKLTAGAMMGAYKKSGTWTPVLGDGFLTFDFLWGNSYSIVGDLNIPSDPYTMIAAALSAKLSSTGAFNASVSVALQLPEVVPVIGGHKFAEADGLVHYDKNDPSSFAAGWASLDLGFYTVRGGIKYIFQQKDFVTIGSDGIDDLKTENQTLPDSDPRYWDFLHINVDNANPLLIQVKVKFKQVLPKFYFDTFYPIAVGKVNYSPMYIVSGADLISSSGMNLTTIPTYTCKWIPQSDSVLFYIMAPGYASSSRATLPTGQYTIEFANNVGADMIESYAVHKIYDAPWAVWTYLYSYFTDASGPLANAMITPKLGYHTRSEVYDIDSSTVRMFFTKHSTDNGTLLKTVNYADYWGTYPPDGEYLKIEGVDFPTTLARGDSLLLYLTIDDGINAMYKSPVQLAAFRPPFNANVSITGFPASAASGIETMLYIQNPADNAWYPADTLKHFTNAAGDVSFPYCLKINTNVKFQFDIPMGYEVDPASTYQNGQALPVSNINADCGKYVTIQLRKTQK
ncbi:MAG: hypothetical protein WBQ23_09415 [Bacteroidota bacterium]